MWMLIVAVIVMAVASSTPAGRAEARERLNKFTRPLWPFVILLWAILISGMIARG